VEDGVRFGLTPNFVRVGVPADAAGENTLLRVRLGASRGDWCEGVAVCAAVEAA
jgi:hypothetical protein